MACIQQCHGNRVVIEGTGKHHVGGSGCTFTRVLVDCGVNQTTLSTKWVLVNCNDLPEKEREGKDKEEGRK